MKKEGKKIYEGPTVGEYRRLKIAQLKTEVKKLQAEIESLERLEKEEEEKYK